MCLTTAPDLAVAERIGRQLVEERLIACANVVPGLLSLFRWQGELSREGEVLMLMKAPEARLERLAARLGELHPYEVPEFLALSVDAGSTAYCRWVHETTEVDT